MYKVNLQTKKPYLSPLSNMEISPTKVFNTSMDVAAYIGACGIEAVGCCGFTGWR